METTYKFLVFFFRLLQNVISNLLLDTEQLLVCVGVKPELRVAHWGRCDGGEGLKEGRIGER
jgi:hypothetical protein